MCVCVCVCVCVGGVDQHPPLTLSLSLSIRFQAFLKRRVIDFLTRRGRGWLRVFGVCVCVCVCVCLFSMAGLTSGEKNHTKEFAFLSSLVFLKKTP